MTFVIVELCLLQIQMLNSYYPIPQNVAGFGGKVFKDDEVKMRSLAEVLIQYDLCSYKKRKIGNTKRDTRHVHTERESRVNTQQEDSHLQAKERGLRKKTDLWPL